VKPDLPAASMRLGASGSPSVLEDDSDGGMRSYLRQRRTARMLGRALTTLGAAAWSEPAVAVAKTTNRGELGSAARPTPAARGWARLDRF
jgi:hypothetical protein